MAYACHPLIAQSKVIGTISFGTRSRTGFTEDELNLMNNVTDQVSIAMQRVMLHQQLQKYSQDLEREVQERTQEIQEKADMIDSLFKHTITPLVLLDREFNFVRVNQEYAKVCSKSVDEFYGHNHFEFYPHEENKAIFSSVVESRIPYQSIAKPFTFPDHPEWGVTYWDWTLTPLLDVDGEVNFLLFSLNNVTERKMAEEKIRTERQRLFSVLEQIPAYVCLITDDYRFAYTNQEFRRRFGNPKDRVCYEFLFDFQKPCEDCQTFRVFTEQRFQQWEWTGPDGNTYAIFDYPFTDIDGSSLILELGIDITKRKIIEDDLKESREKLRNLYAYLQSAIETERTKIAREIHDEFGTLLTALNIDLSWLVSKLPGDMRTLRERITKDVEMVNSAIKMVQRITSELRPGLLDHLGLSSAVEWQVKEFGNRTGIDYDISIDMKTDKLNKDLSVAIFRILQESLTNITRYAEASKVKVSLAENDSILSLEVSDDGKGISEAQLSDGNSYGIMGMRERVQYYGGVINIKGEPNKGTTVTVKVPVVTQGEGE